MASLPAKVPPGLHVLACTLCARRKVKCDRGDPCSTCLRMQAQCLYDAPVLSRPQKRAADEDLVGRVAQYEDLLREHNIPSSHTPNTWVSSGLEVLPKESQEMNPQRPPSAMPAIGRSDLISDPLETTLVNVER